MNTIGKNRAETVVSITNGTDPAWSVPHPDSSMTCDVLLANYNRLNEQIKYWGDTMANLKYHLFSGDKIEAANITKIIEIQTGYLNEYATALQTSCSNNLNVNEDTGALSLTNTTTDQNSSSTGATNWTPILIVAGLGTAYLLTHKKKKQMARRNKDNELLLWLLVGGGVIYALTKKPAADVIVTQPGPTAEIPATDVITDPLASGNVTPDYAAPVDTSFYTSDVVTYNDPLIHPYSSGGGGVDTASTLKDATLNDPTTLQYY